MTHSEHLPPAPHLTWVYTQALSQQLDAATWIETTRQLRAGGWRVTLLTADPEDVQSVRGVDLLPVCRPDTYVVGQLVFHARIVRRLLRNWGQIDIVLFHQMSAPWLLPLRIIRWLRAGTGPRLVMDTRTLPMVPKEHARWQDRLRHAFYLGMSRLANRVADGRTAITARMAEAERIPPEHLLGTWPSAVDLDVFGAAQASRRWPEAEEPVHLIYVGALHRERMLLNLCRAVEAADDSGMHYVLNLIGDGSQRKELVAYAAHTQGRVRVSAPVPHERVPEVLSQAHVGVLPFPDERKFRVSSPIKLYEYLAAGLAVLATRITCHTDVMGDADYAIWAESASDSDLLRSLEILWARRLDLPQMGEHAAQDAGGHTWRDSAMALGAALERVLSRDKPLKSPLFRERVS